MRYVLSNLTTHQCYDDKISTMILVVYTINPSIQLHCLLLLVISKSFLNWQTAWRQNVHKQTQFSLPVAIWQVGCHISSSMQLLYAILLKYSSQRRNKTELIHDGVDVTEWLFHVACFYVDKSTPTMMSYTNNIREFIIFYLFSNNNRSVFTHNFLSGAAIGIYDLSSLHILPVEMDYYNCMVKTRYQEAKDILTFNHTRNVVVNLQALPATLLANYNMLCINKILM